MISYRFVVFCFCQLFCVTFQFFFFSSSVLHPLSPPVSFSLLFFYSTVFFLPIGTRSAAYFFPHEVPLFTQEVLLAADITVGECFQLARRITEGYCKGAYDAVKICYTRFDSMMTQTATTLEVLPLTIEPTEAQKAEARRSQILYKPSCEEVFGAIIPEYVAGVLYGAVCESVASELAARRTAMDAATKNAGEMIEHLNLYYNRARQAAITQEITEIVAGAEN